MTPKNRASRQGYVHGCVMILAGALFSLALAQHQRAALLDEVQTVELPGAHVVEIREPGRYYLYHERLIGVDGEPGAALQGMLFTIHRLDTRAAVTLDIPRASIGYETQTRRGESIAVVEIRKPGAYVLSGVDPEGDDGRTRVGFGPGVGYEAAERFAGALTLLLGSLVLGGWTIARTAFLRRPDAPQPA